LFGGGPRRPPDMTLDQPHVLGRRMVVDAEAAGDSRRTERQSRRHRDRAAVTDRQLEAPPTEIDAHQTLASIDEEALVGSAKDEGGLLITGDGADIPAELVAHRFQQGRPVGRVTDRTRGPGPDLLGTD